MGAITRRSCLLMAAAGLAAEPDDLAATWRLLARESDGEAGAAALDLRSGRRAALNGDDRFPLASVCKLPIAMAILAMVAERKLSLGAQIEVPKYDVVSGVSPIAERWHEQQWFRVEEMISLMVAQSDNTAVQTLFRMAGGAVGMGLRLKAWGIGGVRIDRDERTCGRDATGGLDALPAVREAAMRRFLADPRDTGTPNGTVVLLDKLYAGNILPADLTARLRGILEKTTTGPGRIPALLPPRTVVGHKTGTTADAGRLNGSTNDVGVIALPRGSQLAVAFYLKGSTLPLPAREALIARMARAAYDWAARA